MGHSPRFLLLSFIFTVFSSYFLYTAFFKTTSPEQGGFYLHPRPFLSGKYEKLVDLSKTAYKNFKSLQVPLNLLQNSKPGPVREKAAFVVLVRNEELAGMKASLRGIEDRFNRQFRYPYVFLNDVPFTEQFKTEIRAFTQSEVQFGLIPKEHWGYPSWIDQEKAASQRKKMAKDGVFYGYSESYRHMCRFNSGFFYKHPLLQQFDYYWRIEPDVEYSCDIDSDPFKYMREHGVKYGYTIALYEYFNTIPSLWKTVKGFASANEHLIPSNNSLSWVTNDGGKTYNGCHFWSNFEIGSFEFLRSKEYNAFFDFLDQSGGFFYERWGDAPVHSIAAAMFLNPTQIHWFKDIGYSHRPWTNCPQDPVVLLKCTCDPSQSAIHHPYAQCTTNFTPDLPPVDVDTFVNSGCEPESVPQPGLVVKYEAISNPEPELGRTTSLR